MNLERGRFSDSEGGSEKLDEFRKKPEYSYSRDFLLSFTDLDICKKLPNGFDESLLSEFEDAAQSIPDQPRIPGSHPLQGFRRNQYGSSPPTRGDSSNYSRGTYGKWESRCSGRTDRDSDSQSDRDSDSGRRHGHPSRRPWQRTEQQDGLLGSGSYPRPSGHVSGIFTPKFRANEDRQLNKGSEPYHPPRPYKVVPYSRTDKDSYNDETFGLMECDNEDRAEEERRRRASFEMIRKEQHKALQEKQKLNLEKHNSALFPNLSEVLEDKKEEMGPSAGTKGLEVSAATVVSSNNLDRSFSSQAPASRPLVPPGFRNDVLEKGGDKYYVQTPLFEEKKPEPGGSHLNTEVSIVRDDTQEINIVDRQPLETPSPLDKGGHGKSLYNSDVFVRRPGIEDQMAHASSRLDSHGSLDDPVIVGLNSDALEDKIVGDANSKVSTSILEKIFGGALSMNDYGSDSMKGHHNKLDGTLSCKSAQSSKFAQWLSEEEAKSTDDISSGGPNELLCLISRSDEDQCQVSDSETANFRPDFSLELSNKLTLDLPRTAKGVTNQACANSMEESISNVITCEDLEQSILTEYSAKSTSTKPLSESWNTSDLYSEQTSKHADDHASLHLLSLLQKGSDGNNISLNSDVGGNLDNKPLLSQEHDMNMAVHENKHENGKSVINLGKTITLEALFGSAFMKELQSVDAPISVQRGPREVDAPDSLELFFPAANNNVPSATDLDDLQGPSHNHGVLASGGQYMRSSKTDEWLGLHDSNNRTISSNDHLEEIFKFDGFGTVKLQPPEADLLSHRMLTFMPTHNSVNNVEFSSKGPVNMLGKLAGNAFKDDRVVVSNNLPYPNLDPRLPYPGIQVQQPPPQFQSPQMAPLRPLHNNFESPNTHMSPQMEILGPEQMLTHYASANHQFPSNMIPHALHPPNVGHAGFDVQSLASMQHQMQLSSNQSHFVPDFPRGGPIPHPGNQGAGFIQETNQMQGFLPETCQPNIGSLGLPIPTPDLNSGHNPPPELFQRLIEMGVQANSKHVHPLPSGYSHGLDTVFQYRELR